MRLGIGRGLTRVIQCSRNILEWDPYIAVDPHAYPERRKLPTWLCSAPPPPWGTWGDQFRPLSHSWSREGRSLSLLARCLPMYPHSAWPPRASQTGAQDVTASLPLHLCRSSASPWSTRNTALSRAGHLTRGKRKKNPQTPAKQPRICPHPPPVDFPCHGTERSRTVWGGNQPGGWAVWLGVAGAQGSRWAAHC